MTKLIFEERDKGQIHASINVSRPGADGPERICTLSKRGNMFYITEVYPNQYSDIFAHTNFKEPEFAGIFVDLFLRKMAETLDANPLSFIVSSFLEVRARSLREQKAAAINTIRNVEYEQAYLKEISKKHLAGRLDSYLYDVQPNEEIIKDFCEFKIDDKSLIDHIYEEFGKDTGRTYRALLARLLKIIDPVLAEKYN